MVSYIEEFKQRFTYSLKKLLASGASPSDPHQGLCPWTPLRARPPDPRYTLALPRSPCVSPQLPPNLKTKLRQWTLMFPLDSNCFVLRHFLGFLYSAKHLKSFLTCPYPALKFLFCLSIGYTDTEVGNEKIRTSRRIDSPFRKKFCA